MINKIAVLILGCVITTGIVVAEEVSNQVAVPPVQSPEVKNAPDVATPVSETTTPTQAPTQAQIPATATSPVVQNAPEAIEQVAVPTVPASEVPPPEFRRPSKSVSITRETDNQKSTVTHHVGGDVYNIFIEGDNNTVTLPVPKKAPAIIPPPPPPAPLPPAIKEKVEVPAPAQSSKLEPVPTISTVVVVAEEQKKVNDGFFGFSVSKPFLSAEKQSDGISNTAAEKTNFKFYLGSWFDDSGFGFEVGGTKLGKFKTGLGLTYESEANDNLYRDEYRAVTSAKVGYLRFMLGYKTKDGVRLYASVGKYGAKVKYSIDVSEKTYREYNGNNRYHYGQYTLIDSDNYTISGTDKKKGKLVGLGLDADIGEHGSFRMELNRYVDLGAFLGFNYKHVDSVELGFNARF
ncbi:MAG: hypothetical protein QM538_06090 [Methylacidiphilales bacterium]|nr:hypothetical protein [Candidatus Methylacidiphilales bacterium]